MKKTAILAFALTVGMTFVSCNQQQKAPADQDAATETTDAQADSIRQAEEDAERADIKFSMNGLLKRAKNEGANWDEAYWRDAYKELFTYAKPTLLRLQELSKLASDDKASKADVMSMLTTNETDFRELSEQMDEFRRLANATASGKKVMQDTEYAKQIMKELGLPESLKGDAAK